MLTAANGTYVIYLGCVMYILRKWDLEKLATDQDDKWYFETHYFVVDSTKLPVQIDIPILDKQYAIIDSSKIPMELLPFHHLGITTLPETIIALNELGYY